MSHMQLRLKKIAVTLAATALAIAGVVTVGAAPAAAAGFQVRLSPFTNKFLYVEVSGASTQPGAAVIQWSYTGGSNQVWTLRPSGANYEVVNSRSGQCLTTDGVAGHGLYQWPCYGWSRQQWDTALTPGSPDAFSFYNPASDLYMDVEGASFWQGAHLVGWYANNGDNQFFKGWAA